MARDGKEVIIAIHKITPKVRAYLRRYVYELVELDYPESDRSREKRTILFDGMTTEEKEAANQFVGIIFKRYL